MIRVFVSIGVLLEKKMLTFPALLVCIKLFIFLSNDIYLPAVMDIMADLDIPENWMHYSLTAWFLGAASSQLLIAPLCERFGRRPILLGGGLLFVIASLACANAATAMGLMSARFFQGVAVSIVNNTSCATIHESYGRHEAIALSAWMSGITVLAPLLGPLIGVWLLHFVSWRVLFLGLALGCSICLVFLYWYMPETNHHGKTKVMSLRSIFLQYYNIVTNKQFMQYSMPAAMLMGGIIAWLSAGPFLIHDVYELNQEAFGWAQIFICLSYTLATRLLHKDNYDQWLALGKGVLLFSSVLFLCLPSFDVNHVLLLVVLMVAYNFAGGLCFTLMQRFAIESSQENMDSRVAILSTCSRGVSAISSAVVALLYNQTLGSFTCLMGGVALLAGLMMRSKSI